MGAEETLSDEEIKEDIINQKNKERRDKLAFNYKKRVSNFMNDMIFNPVVHHDPYLMKKMVMSSQDVSRKSSLNNTRTFDETLIEAGGEELISSFDNIKMKKPIMRFNAPKCDEEIIEQMRKRTQIVDTDYVEQSSWPIRKTQKEKHLGRSTIHLKEDTRMEQLHSSLKN